MSTTRGSEVLAELRSLLLDEAEPSTRLRGGSPPTIADPASHEAG